MHASTRPPPAAPDSSFIGVTAAASAVLAVGLTASSAAAASGEYAGTLADGTAWRAVVPDDWNGTLLLYSHGYQPSFAGPARRRRWLRTPPQSSCFSKRDTRWSGSTYEATGWAVPTAPDDQLESLDAALVQIGEQPDHVSSHTEHRWVAWSRGASPSRRAT